MYQRILDVSIWVFALLALLGALLLVSWNTAGGQSPTPTPDGMECITPTPSGEQWCMIPPVAVTVTLSNTPVPPTSEVTPAGELTPFVPTSTPSPTPSPTRTPRPRVTITLTAVRIGSNAHLPIVWK